ncbi:hypothetical protein BU15DRAFT_80112 [Melanogaster broomeanus]|nr:hypothetical protein BU15DRAFT_80112 [Melanogaster broomeanus]
MSNPPAVRRNPPRGAAKRKRNSSSLASIHGDAVGASGSGQPGPKRICMKSLSAKGHTPIDRKRSGVSTSSSHKNRARQADPNNGLCLLTRRGEPVVQACHVVGKATEDNILTKLEYAWVRSDWHILFDKGLWLLVPQLEDLQKLETRTTLKSQKDRPEVNLDDDNSWEQQTFQYHVLRMPDLKEPIHRFDGPEEDAGYTVHSLPFPNLGLPHQSSQLEDTLGQVSHETPQSARDRLNLLHDFQPPSERAPSADGEGDAPDDGSRSTGD